MTLPAKAQELVKAVGQGSVVWLTGAGISAESGIPTFRGEQGYWKVGSTNYQPQELATMAAFRRMPREIWAWYLHRRSVCRQASPNAAHTALVALESALQDRFVLVTQNVDGLHIRAGNSLERTLQIHGNVDYMRRVGGQVVVPLPESLGSDWPRDRRLTDAEYDSLRLKGKRTRPHVLWFDETYSEALYRYESSLEATYEASMLVIVGTTGATNLPYHMGVLAQKMGIPMVVINPESNPFVEMLEDGPGIWLQGTAGQWVPELVEALLP